MRKLVERVGTGNQQERESVIWPLRLLLRDGVEPLASAIVATAMPADRKATLRQLHRQPAGSHRRHDEDLALDKATAKSPAARRAKPDVQAQMRTQFGRSQTLSERAAKDILVSRYPATRPSARSGPSSAGSGTSPASGSRCRATT